MATYLKGILGSFSGKVGNVVGTYWKGKAVMRSLAAHVHNPKTPAQEEQRARLTVASRFISAVFPLIKEGYAKDAKEESESNAAMRDILRDAVISTGTSASIDLTRVQLSKGTLINPGNPTVVQGTGHSVDVSWTDNSHSSRDASSEDTVMVSLYNPTVNAANNDVSSYIRSNEECTINYPADWAGATLTLFMAAKSPDGKLISNSINVGSITAE